MNISAEIRDPVHGYLCVSDIEKEIIDTPLFQRLRRIRQLSGAHLTYPGAQHSRFEHSLGTMHLAGLAIKVLALKVSLSEEEKQELKLAALLHDIGHGPFSHLIEEVMVEKRNITHEDVTQRVLRETEIQGILSKRGYSEDLPDLALGLCMKKRGFMNDVVRGGLSVDIMDYLLRDSYFTGVEYGKVDVQRVINSFEVVNDRLGLDYAALYAFEALMIARYEMFRAVYFHRTVRAAEIMLMKAVALADDELQLTNTDDLSRYLSLTDDAALDRLVNLDPRDSQDLKQAKKLATDYRNRKLVKCVFERLVLRQDGFIERVFSQKRIRNELSAEIAGLSGIDSDDVYIDVPTTPSVPFTSSRQALSTIILVLKNGEGRKLQTVNVQNLPLVGAISGFFDILRVYTSAEHRWVVEKAANKLFGGENFSTKISM